MTAVLERPDLIKMTVPVPFEFTILDREEKPLGFMLCNDVILAVYPSEIPGMVKQEAFCQCQSWKMAQEVIKVLAKILDSHYEYRYYTWLEYLAYKDYIPERPKKVEEVFDTAKEDEDGNANS